MVLNIYDSTAEIARLIDVLPVSVMTTTVLGCSLTNDLIAATACIVLPFEKRA